MLNFVLSLRGRDVARALGGRIGSLFLAIRRCYLKSRYSVHFKDGPWPIADTTSASGSSEAARRMRKILNYIAELYRYRVNGL
jgi:hypothetical protein